MQPSRKPASHESEADESKLDCAFIECIERRGHHVISSVFGQDCRISPARASALNWRLIASTRAIITSGREHPKRIAHSASDCPSREAMTKTKRSKASSKRMDEKGSFSAAAAALL